jgi:hypothetical protein
MKKIRQIVPPTLIAFCAILLLVSPAVAGRSWCMKDPIVRLNGVEVQIWVAIPEEFVPAVNGPIAVFVRTPHGVVQETVLLDDGFNGYSEVVTYGTHAGTVADDGSFDADITVAVPVDLRIVRGMRNAREIPVQVTLVQGDRTEVVEGTNNGMTVTTRVTPPTD